MESEGKSTDPAISQERAGLMHQQPTDLMDVEWPWLPSWTFSLAVKKILILHLFGARPCQLLQLCGRRPRHPGSMHRLARVSGMTKTLLLERSHESR